VITDQEDQITSVKAPEWASTSVLYLPFKLSQSSSTVAYLLSSTYHSRYWTWRQMTKGKVEEIGQRL
jgi:hypothetical protein